MLCSKVCGLTPSPTDSDPWGSKSTSSTRRPSSASAAPRLIVVVVLPTPPFWLHIAMTVAGPWLASGGGSGRPGQGRPVGPISVPSSPMVSGGSKRSTGRDFATPYLLLHHGPALLLRRSLIRARVRSEVYLAQVVDSHQCVDLRGGHGGVSEQLLDHPDIGTAVQQVGGEAVPQGVR